MTVTAKIITDSISPDGIRLTTIQLRYPRMVHADLMTHRVFSRNGRSSRAVPFATLVKEQPYTPHFMLNKPGMVASEEMPVIDRKAAELIWNKAAWECQEAARKLAELGVHKQWVNRMLEWFGYIDVLISSTEWANFFALRDEAGAQPEIQEIARAVKAAMDGSKPQLLNPGQWHLPYVSWADDAADVEDYLATVGKTNIHGVGTQEDILETLKKISVARCARLTIKPFDGDGSIEKELKRYSLLMESRPVHASPAEHIATPDNYKTYEGPDQWGKVVKVKLGTWDNEHEHGNFCGWRQFRKQIPHNTVY